MSVEDRRRWDEIFRQRVNKPYPPPDPLLLQYTPPVAPERETRALDLAGGLGQNGLWLASQGYIVDVMDISRVALKRARAEMALRNLRTVNLIQVDLDKLELDDDTYDLICVFRYLKRPLFPLLKRTLRPGGRLIYETYNRQYLEQVPGFNPDFLLDVGELAEIFTDWDILFHDASSASEQIVTSRPQFEF